MDESAHRGAFDADLRAYILARVAEFDRIDAARRARLLELTAAITRDGASAVVFICTHNSRRSHFGQVWMRAAALWYGLPPLQTFSGGTEATAFAPNAVAALQRAGLHVERLEDARNPRYRVRLSAGATSSIAECFSKRYDAPPNPQTDFIAVMTCAEADAACPLVAGAAVRVALPYDDPKDHDGTDREAAAYDAACARIARELLYCCEHVTLS